MRWWSDYCVVELQACGNQNILSFVAAWCLCLLKFNACLSHVWRVESLVATMDSLRARTRAIDYDQPSCMLLLSRMGVAYCIKLRMLPARTRPPASVSLHTNVTPTTSHPLGFGNKAFPRFSHKFV